MGFAGPRGGNVYLIDSKSFTTAAVGWEHLLIENPDSSDPDDAYTLASRGQSITELLMYFGPGVWPASEALTLLNATKCWLIYNNATRKDMSELLLAGFNNLCPPATAMESLEWARVQWHELNVVTAGHFQAQSVDDRFVVDIHFTDDHVIVSYSGPDHFSLAFVQQAVPRVFAREEVFATEVGDWESSSRSFWTAEEAQLLAGIVQR
jgi:hypothetical protein